MIDSSRFHLIDARPLEHVRCERDEALHRHVFAAAERAADLGVFYNDVIFGQGENFRQLLAIFVQPLTGRFDDDAALLIEIRNAGIGLQIRVFLPLRRKRAFNDYVGIVEGSRNVAVADLLMQQHVVESGMHALRAGLHRHNGIGDDRQIFIHDDNEFRGLVRRNVRFGAHERDAIAVMAHRIVAEHRLIGVDQTVAIVRHVFRCEHGNDARHGERRRRIDRDDLCMPAPREHGLEPHHAGRRQIGRIVCGTGDFIERVVARMRFADVLH